MRPDNPMRNFDPRKVAYYEKENYVAYYQKDWLTLLRVSVGLVKESFALSLWQGDLWRISCRTSGDCVRTISRERCPKSGSLHAAFLSDDQGCSSRRFRCR